MISQNKRRELFKPRQCWGLLLNIKFVFWFLIDGINWFNEMESWHLVHLFNSICIYRFALLTQHWVVLPTPASLLVFSISPTSPALRFHFPLPLENIVFPRTNMSRYNVYVHVVSGENSEDNQWTLLSTLARANCSELIRVLCCVPTSCLLVSGARAFWSRARRRYIQGTPGCPSSTGTSLRSGSWCTSCPAQSTSCGCDSEKIVLSEKRKYFNQDGLNYHYSPAWEHWGRKGREWRKETSCWSRAWCLDTECLGRTGSRMRALLTGLRSPPCTPEDTGEPPALKERSAMLRMWGGESSSSPLWEAESGL